MKMLKKMAALLLAGVMAMALLTACGGDDTPSFGKQVEDATIKALNTALGDGYNLTNDSTLRAMAASTLDKVTADGKIAAKYGYAGSESEDKTSMTVTIAVANYAEAEELLESGKGDTLIDAMKVTAKDLANLQNANSADLKQLGQLIKAMGGDVKVGVATKTMANGDTYLAVTGMFTIPEAQ